MVTIGVVPKNFRFKASLLTVPTTSLDGFDGPIIPTKAFLTIFVNKYTGFPHFSLCTVVTAAAVYLDFLQNVGSRLLEDIPLNRYLHVTAFTLRITRFQIVE